MSKKIVCMLICLALVFWAVPGRAAERQQLFKNSKTEGRQKYSLNTTVRLQMKYEYCEGDGQYGKERWSRIEARRVRLQFDGDVWSELGYKLELSLDKLSEPQIKDAWLSSIHLGPYAKLRIGQFKTPFSRQRILSSSRLQIIDRSPIQNLYPGRDTGIELSGKDIMGVFDYAVAMEMGWGDRMKFVDTDNSRFWYDGRFVFHPLGSLPMAEGDVSYSEKLRFEVAGNVLYAPHQVAFGERSIHDMFLAADAYGLPVLKDAARSTLSDLPSGLIGDTFSWGPDITIFYKGFSLTGEYYKASYTPDDTSQYRKLYSKGYFIQGGIFIIPKLIEITGRYDRLDRDTKTRNQKDTREYTLGVNYFFSEDHRCKFQINYIWRLEDRNEYDNNSLVFNAQVLY